MNVPRNRSTPSVLTRQRARDGPNTLTTASTAALRLPASSAVPVHWQSFARGESFAEIPHKRSLPAWQKPPPAKPDSRMPRDCAERSRGQKIDNLERRAHFPHSISGRIIAIKAAQNQSHQTSEVFSAATGRAAVPSAARETLRTSHDNGKARSNFRPGRSLALISCFRSRSRERV